MLKTFKMYENNSEKIKTEVLIDDLKKNKDFKDLCDGNRVEWVIDLFLHDYIGLNFDFPESEKFELVDAWKENGEYYQEETKYGIFKRKEDGKYFKFTINSSPDDYFMYPHLEETRKKQPKRKFDWE